MRHLGTPEAAPRHFALAAQDRAIQAFHRRGIRSRCQLDAAVKEHQALGMGETGAVGAGCVNPADAGQVVGIVPGQADIAQCQIEPDHLLVPAGWQLVDGGLGHDDGGYRRR
jgi:hypothetical protein